MKFQKKYGKTKHRQAFAFICFAIYFYICTCMQANGESLFYTPKQPDAKTHEISQKSFLETSYGDSNAISGRDLRSFHRFQKGRLNVRSVVQAQDFETNYKALLDVQIGTDVNEDQSTLFYINQGYIELKNNAQPIKTKLKIGIQNTANAMLAVNSSTAMKNHQGINGNWYRYIQMPVINMNGGYNPTFVINSMPLSSQGFTDATFLYSKNSGNLNFVQPSPNWSSSNLGIGFSTERKNGVMFAVSYQPSQNTGNFGINANGGYDRRGIMLEGPGNSMFTKNLTSTVINYLDEFGGVAINASFGYEFADFNTNHTVVDIARHKLSQYIVGANLSYLGMTFGGSYSNAGKSLLLKQNAEQLQSFSTKNAHLLSATSGGELLQAPSNLTSFEDTYNMDFGISYSIANFQAGVSHAKSHFAGNRFSATVLSLSEDLLPKYIKLTAMYELGFYEFLSASYFTNNGGNLQVKSVPKMHGIVASIGLRAYI